MSNQLEKVKELIELRAKARLGGGEKAIEKQHAKGKWFMSLRKTLPYLQVLCRKPCRKRYAR